MSIYVPNNVIQYVTVRPGSDFSPPIRLDLTWIRLKVDLKSTAWTQTDSTRLGDKPIDFRLEVDLMVFKIGLFLGSTP